MNLGGREAGKESWFSPEHLEIQPYQKYKGRLSENDASVMIERACRSPGMNRASIVEEGLAAMGLQKGALTDLVRSVFLLMYQLAYADVTS